ncbi:CCR4-Not complex component, Not1-domain-containing protein [Limtongia smithiae]|uniref:CCR4-Not complex component, Not1-domain-containing protein n=1 Tax=Limtongia smithiae TaxID=1125753 RepID=UPI0034CFCE90
MLLPSRYARYLCDHNGPEVYQKYFRRLIAYGYSAASSRSTEGPMSKRLLSEELSILASNPSLSYKFTDSISASDTDNLKDFQLHAFFDAFQLDPFQRTILCLGVKQSWNTELQLQAFDILADNFSSFLASVRDKAQYPSTLTDSNIAIILNQFVQDPVPSFFDSRKQASLFNAIRTRYALSSIPSSIAVILDAPTSLQTPLESLQELLSSVQASGDEYKYDGNIIVRIASDITDPAVFEELVHCKPYSLALDLFSHFARVEKYPLLKFVDQVLATDNQGFIIAIINFLNFKASSEYTQQQQQQQPQPDSPEQPDVLPLHVQVVYDLMHVVLKHTIPSEYVEIWEGVQAQCIQTYPRLINFGRGHDPAILVNSATNSFSPEVEKQMKYYYKKMYEQNMNEPKTQQDMSITEVISLLQNLRTSDDPSNQDIFACMVHSLFDEYRFFPGYPAAALATTAVLFGAIIQYHLIEDIPLDVALRFVLEALREPPDVKMFKFGVEALMQFQFRLEEFPQYCAMLLQVTSLENLQPLLFKKLRSITNNESIDSGNMLQEKQNGDSLAAPLPPPFRSLHLDSSSPGEQPSEDPDEEVQDKILFIVNNVAQSNIEQKSSDLKSILDEKYYQWFAQYLVDTRVKQEPNYHMLYIEMLDLLNDSHLIRQVLYNTYASIITLLNSPETVVSSSERGRLKNLGGWLGILTIARDKSIKHKNISFKDLLIEAFDSNRLIIALPFTCKVLEKAVNSRIFRPPNPWLMGILKLMVELYTFAELKLNLKFEIELLCKTLNIEISEIEPSTLVRHRPPKTELLDEADILGRPEMSDEFNRLSLAGYNRLDARTNMPVSDNMSVGTPTLSTSYLPTTVLNHPSLKRIVQVAVDKAIREILGLVVERSATIAVLATQELTSKDFALEGDDEKLRSAAHNMVRYLASNLALVTCKEPLRINISNNIRTLLVSSGYGESSLTADVLNVAVNEQLDRACAVIQQKAIEKGITGVDEALAEAYVRRRHRDLRQPFIDSSVSLHALNLPEPFRLKTPGLTRQQLRVYEDFGKPRLGNGGLETGSQTNEFANSEYAGLLQSHMQPHPLQQQQQQQQQQITLQQQSQQRMMPIMTQQAQQQGLLQQQQPDMSMHTAQQLVQENHSFGAQSDITRAPMNRASVVVDPAVQAAIENLLAAVKESSETSFDQLAPESRVKVTVTAFLNAVVNRMPNRDQFISVTAQCVVSMLFTAADSQLARETLAFLLARLCDYSVTTAKEVVLWLIHSEDERKFNVPVMITLMKMRLVHPQELDVNLSKQIQARRRPAIEFIAKLIHEAVLGESPCALRTEFSLCLEAMKTVAAEAGPSQAIARQLIASLETAAVPTVPNADEGYAVKDNMKYIFHEWVRLTQHPAQNEKLLFIFILQMSENGLLEDSKFLGVFFRSALEYCVDAYAKDLEARNSGLTAKDGVIAVDSLAKLVIMLFRVHDENEETTKIHYLRGILSVFCLVFAHEHETQAGAFNGLPFFRLFSSILCQWAEIEDAHTEFKDEFYSLITDIFKTLQPMAFPGFTFAWMSMISHRMYMPKILNLERRKGWAQFADLLEELMKFIGMHLVGTELPDSIRYIYKGTLRIVLVLLHDVPEFLAQYHYTLCNAVPICCIQLRNLILSAFPHNMTLPDPTAAGFKIERLAESRQDPVIARDPGEDLQQFEMKKFVDAYLKSGGSGMTMTTLVEQLGAPARSEIGLGFDTVTTNIAGMNAVVLYVGTQAVEDMKVNSGSGTVVFDAMTVYVRFMRELMQALNAEGRFFLFGAMANQLRYPNSHTFYFSALMLQLYEGTDGAEESEQRGVREQIARVVLERVLCHRPHPWGLLLVQGVTQREMWRRGPQE